MRALLVLALVLGCGGVWAQAPAGSTGLCKDGTYTTAAKKRGSCKENGGVKAWFGAPIPLAEGPVVAAKTAAAQPVVAEQPSVVVGDPVAPKQDEAAATAPLVWVNLSSKVYHCPASEWYGKTSNGKYMTEQEAVAMGARASRSKVCAK